jgi:hypothetical protein
MTFRKKKHVSIKRDTVVRADCLNVFSWERTVLSIYSDVQVLF